MRQFAVFAAQFADFVVTLQLPFIIPEDVFFDGCYYALCVPLAGSNELLQTQTPATPLSDHDAIFELGLHFLGETPKSLFSHPLHARPVSDR